MQLSEFRGFRKFIETWPRQVRDRGPLAAANAKSRARSSDRAPGERGLLRPRDDRSGGAPPRTRSTFTGPSPTTSTRAGSAARAAPSPNALAPGSIKCAGQGRRASIAVVATDGRFGRALSTRALAREIASGIEMVAVCGDSLGAGRGRGCGRRGRAASSHHHAFGPAGPRRIARRVNARLRVESEGWALESSAPTGSGPVLLQALSGGAPSATRIDPSVSWRR